MLVYYKATLTDILSGSLHNRPYTQAAHTPKQTLEKINIANAHVYFDTASVLGFLTRRSSLLVIGMQWTCVSFAQMSVSILFASLLLVKWNY